MQVLGPNWWCWGGWGGHGGYYHTGVWPLMPMGCYHMLRLSAIGCNATHQQGQTRAPWGAPSKAWPWMLGGAITCKWVVRRAITIWPVVWSQVGAGSACVMIHGKDTWIGVLATTRAFHYVPPTFLGFTGQWDNMRLALIFVEEMALFSNLWGTDPYMRDGPEMRLVWDKSTSPWCLMRSLLRWILIHGKKDFVPGASWEEGLGDQHVGPPWHPDK